LRQHAGFITGRRGTQHPVDSQRLTVTPFVFS
jgi:hypothetical protein